MRLARLPMTIFLGLLLVLSSGTSSIAGRPAASKTSNASSRSAAKKKSIGKRTQFLKKNIVGMNIRGLIAKHKRPGFVAARKKFIKDKKFLRGLVHTRYSKKTPDVTGRSSRAIAEVYAEALSAEDNFTEAAYWTSDAPAVKAATEIMLSSPESRQILMKSVPILQAREKSRIVRDWTPELLSTLFIAGSRHGFRPGMVKAFRKNGLPREDSTAANSKHSSALLARARAADLAKEQLEAAINAGADAAEIEKLSREHSLSDYTNWGMVPYVQQKQMKAMKIEETREWLNRAQEEEVDPLAIAVYDLLRFRVARGLQFPKFGGRDFGPMVDFGTNTVTGVIKRIAGMPSARRERFRKDLASLMGVLRSTEIQTGQQQLDKWDPEVAAALEDGSLIGTSPEQHRVEDYGARGSVASLIKVHFQSVEPALIPMLEAETAADVEKFFSNRSFRWRTRETAAGILTDLKR